MEIFDTIRFSFFKDRFGCFGSKYCPLHWSFWERVPLFGEFIGLSNRFLWWALLGSHPLCPFRRFWNCFPVFFPWLGTRFCRCFRLNVWINFQCWLDEDSSLLLFCRRFLQAATPGSVLPCCLKFLLFFFGGQWCSFSSVWRAPLWFLPP